MNKLFLTLCIFTLQVLPVFSQQKYTADIIIKSINYNDERISLSLKYLKDRHGLVQERPIIVPKFVVLHFTGGGTLQSNFNYFNKVKIESGRKYNKNQSDLNVSAHYLVDRDGKIYQLMPDTLFARHTIGLNYCAIGVENIGGGDAPLTAAQVEANIKLVRHLHARYGIKYLIGHSEYGRFRKSAFWKETDTKYFTGKIDPGEDFMKQVRAGLKELNLGERP
jgi:N-acetylmuramoyl-L-alanine amidase